MINITTVVADIIFADQIHLEALRQKTLNLRAFAKMIQKEVMQQTKKSVQIGSIVMALSRIRKSLPALPSFKPIVKITTLSIKSGLTVVNYEKTSQHISLLSKASITRNDKDFFVLSEGLTEIAIIAPDNYMTKIEKLLPTKPKSMFNNAVAIALTFDEKYVTVPNVLYTFVSSLALKRVNLLEIVSTLTEVFFVIEEKYMEDAMNVFKAFL